MGRARKYDKRVRDVSKMFEPFMNDLKFLMEEQKLSAKEFSKKLGQSDSYISSNLNNIKDDRNPSLSFLEAVADHLDAGIVYKNGYYYMAKLPEGVS
jgi:transcriptional regulator with XRE-family HTH domain